MNISDSERIAGFLELHKFKPAKDIDSADLVVFNTCGVRQSAEDRAYGQIHNLRKYETRSTKSETKRMIILTGCLANRKDVQRRLKGKVDLFFPINDFKKFKNSLKIVNCKLKISAQKDISLNKENVDYLSINPKYANAYQAFVPIMTGCNNFCSYCVVPYARGREISRPAKKIIREVKNLIKKGYKEIVLLGQNVNSYKDGKINFSKLLKKINAISSNFWIQFLSNHPKDVTDEMIETVVECEKVCECFHLPIQSGNDEIIKRMNRKYTAKQYLALVDKIKKAYKKYKPGVPYSITSDIILGFPGETKKQFLDSAEIMKKVKYDMVYFGQYSPRPGTVSWKMKDNISKKEKARREKYLNEILKKTAFENNKKYAGRIFDVLVEKLEFPKVELLEESLALIVYFGKTRTMKNVKFESQKKNFVGKFVKVKIKKANVWNLEGELIG